MSKSNLDGWESAILDAQKMIQESKQKIARLRQAVKTFRKLRDAGEPWPGTSEGGEKGTDRAL